MELSTKVIGRMTCNTATVLRHGLMARGMRVTTRRARSMVKELTYGLMDLVTLVTGLITKSMDRVFIPG